MNVSFLILAMVTLVAAGATMLFRSLVHCALTLAVAFAGIGMLYLNLDAQFLGLAQLLVYVGAIAVLIVFVILLTHGGESDGPRLPATPPPVAGLLIAVALIAVIAWAVLHSSVTRAAVQPTPQTTIRQLGVALMQGYVLPLEVIGLMLTAALIGAVIVAMKEKPGTR